MPLVGWLQTQLEPHTHLHHNPQILDIVFFCLYQLIQDKPEQEIKNNEGSSSLWSKKSSHSSWQESYFGTFMTRAPQTPHLPPLGQVLSGALPVRGPTPRGAFPGGTQQPGRQRCLPLSIFLPVLNDSSSLLVGGRYITEQLYRPRAWGVTGTLAKLSYESFEAKGSPWDFSSFISTPFCDYQEEKDICLIANLWGLRDTNIKWGFWDTEATIIQIAVPGNQPAKAPVRARKVDCRHSMITTFNAAASPLPSRCGV